MNSRSRKSAAQYAKYKKLLPIEQATRILYKLVILSFTQAPA